MIIETIAILDIDLEPLWRKINPKICRILIQGIIFALRSLALHMLAPALAISKSDITSDQVSIV
ncbi:hypothetical protein DCAR_0519481 [Daucus carota subsp. sativus]|uniref:Uncharacterized protein n=1 Tax=Daucus carota subsp. sativus TaxID=79200 RepID=A0A162A1N8_DAUCS|nr:hypothetical protein DCAR_0519481 [Daucus carota subsp. sativus]